METPKGGLVIGDPYSIAVKRQYEKELDMAEFQKRLWRRWTCKHCKKPGNKVIDIVGDKVVWKCPECGNKIYTTNGGKILTANVR